MVVGQRMEVVVVDGLELEIRRVCFGGTARCLVIRFGIVIARRRTADIANDEQHDTLAITGDDEQHDTRHTNDNLYIDIAEQIRGPALLCGPRRCRR